VSSETLDGQAQTWSAYLLGRNEYGTWLYVPDRTPLINARGEQVDTLQGQAQLMPTDGCWVAAWRQDGSCLAHVAVPPVVDQLSVRIIDFGLQLRVDDDGRLDRTGADSYERAVAAGLVSAEQDHEIRATFADLHRQLSEAVEPFGRVGWCWYSGITRNELHFVAYDPQWPARFEAARDEILPLLPMGSRVEHVGSTAVPGLSAKDCIDIAVTVPHQEQFSETIAALESIGYETRPDATGDPGHVFIRRLTNGRRSHHVHLYHQGHQNLIEVLALRDLLRTDPRARDRYQSVKLAHAEANPYDRGGYMAGKKEVVEELTSAAMERLHDDNAP